MVEIRRDTQSEFFGQINAAYASLAYLPPAERIKIWWLQSGAGILGALAALLLSLVLRVFTGTAMAQTPGLIPDNALRSWTLLAIIVLVLAGIAFSLYTVFFSKKPTAAASDASKVFIGFALGAATSFLNL